MPKILRFKKATILSVTAAISVVTIGAGAYALQPHTDIKNDKEQVSSAESSKKIETPKAESTQTAEVATPADTPVVAQPQQSTAPETTPVVNEDAELNKRCELVNLTIDHIKSSLGARGQTPANQDVLKELNISPQNRLASTYYQECVAAGKTTAL